MTGRIDESTAYGCAILSLCLRCHVPATAMTAAVGSSRLIAVSAMPVMRVAPVKVSDGELRFESIRKLLLASRRTILSWHVNQLLWVCDAYISIISRQRGSPYCLPLNRVEVGLGKVLKALRVMLETPDVHDIDSSTPE